MFKPGNIRLDSRRLDEMRKITYSKQSNTRVDASVQFGFGEVQVLASVTGPLEVSIRDEIVDKSTIEVEFRSLNGVVGVQYTSLANQVEESLKSVIIGEQHPRSLIRFVVQTLSSPMTPSYLVKQAIGAPPFRIPVSEKAAAINGAIMAALEGSIPMSAIVIAVSLAVINNTIILDPTSYEEANATSVHLIAYKYSTSTRAITLMDSVGEFGDDVFEDFILYQMSSILLHNTHPMPKNKGKGGKNRRRGKNDNENDKRELIFKEEGQEYAQVSRMLGNGRLEASCFDGNKRLGHIRGKMRKKVWIGNGDIVLLSLREFEDEKADIIHKYSPDEARALKQYGELPNEARINENEAFGDDDLEGEIEFGEQQDEQGDEDSEESEVDINDL
ncbi:hypothetical protein E3P84_02642 [Wallemia ichthyophaga]|nr:hypothetical protein E3P98_02792 [Wallemia ichthyophaga]TIB32223.1 hypothetical protein E3P84_02642 [Wallemia ichthyophaga]TIB40896.1 hypothetical protein E3P83_02542 [Wallemia ichthyophaga]TIB61423.1 hypothetical protein E3P78_02786 [Wallemia ichthyophaga]